MWEMLNSLTSSLSSTMSIKKYFQCYLIYVISHTYLIKKFIFCRLTYLNTTNVAKNEVREMSF